MGIHLCRLYPGVEGIWDQGLESRDRPVKAHVPIASPGGILLIALIDDMGNTSLWVIRQTVNW